MQRSRTVVISGGSGGIGEALVRVFAQNGDRVAFSYLKNESAAMDIQNEMRKINPSVSAFAMDVRDSQSVKNFYEKVKAAYGATHVLINNAAISQQKLFCDITDDEWENMIEINLTGAFKLTRAFLKDMLSAKEGCIINISSIWGVCGASCETHYSASKAGIIGLTKALAKETALCGVRVNAISPGLINTKMNAHLNQADKEAFAEEVPLNREGEPNEVAKAALFLASEGASYITGQNLNVDGGYNI